MSLPIHAPPSNPERLPQDDPIIIRISGLTGLKDRDADFVPVLSSGGRLCLNGGGVWRQGPGELRMQVVHGLKFPAEEQSTFRFVVHVDPTVTARLCPRSRRQSAAATERRCGGVC